MRCEHHMARALPTHEDTSSRQIHMRRFAFFTGFVLLTTAIAVPLFLLKKGNAIRPQEDDNIRYDIDDYIATEGL